MRTLHDIGLEDVHAAARRIATTALRTPLVRLNVEDAPGEIWLKLENLQPIGSFKLRGAANAMLQLDRERLADGVWTPSAGNMAQGVAWMARSLGVRCRAVVPEHAPRTKQEALARLGAEVVRVPFEAWWHALETGRWPAAAGAAAGTLVHPVADPAVIAGNGTVGLEILADLPDADAVLVPFGGGGLVSGIATAVRALRPATRVYACEIETATPLAAALAAGAPAPITHRKSFVDGIGGASLLPQMWPLVRRLVDGALVATLAETGAALRLVAERNRVIAEGAGAVPVAAALAGRAGGGKLVCVVSGGNIDPATLCTILSGALP